jgi:hypothetical protein
VTSLIQYLNGDSYAIGSIAIRVRFLSCQMELSRWCQLGGDPGSWDLGPERLS